MRTEEAIQGLITVLDKINNELNKLNQEIIKLNERLEDATTCAGGGK